MTGSSSFPSVSCLSTWSVAGARAAPAMSRAHAHALRRTLATGRLSAWACALLIAGAARAPATDQVLKQLTDGKEELPVIYTTMNDSGTKVWVASNSNQFGDNPNRE